MTAIPEYFDFFLMLYDYKLAQKSMVHNLLFYFDMKADLVIGMLEF